MKLVWKKITGKVAGDTEFEEPRLEEATSRFGEAQTRLRRRKMVRKVVNGNFLSVDSTNII